MRVDTRGYTGKVRKSAKVYVNNPQDRFHYISIEALVKPAVSVRPQAVFLEGRAGDVARQSVEIRAEKKRALRLEPSRFDLENKVTYTLEEVQPGVLYRVHFTNVPSPAGITHGFLTLKTNYPEKPEVSIRIRCKFRN